MPGLRTTHHASRVVIPFTVDAYAMVVWVLGFHYGGQDYEAAY
jgi:hypothetical protein